MADIRVEELLERLICVDLHYRGIPQQNIALFLGKKKAYVNALLKPLGKRQDGER